MGYSVRRTANTSPDYAPLLAVLVIVASLAAMVLMYAPLKRAGQRSFSGYRRVISGQAYILTASQAAEYDSMTALGFKPQGFK